MTELLRVAVVGVGRIGVFHARFVQELARERGDCVLVAVVDGHGDTAGRVAAQLQGDQSEPIASFTRVEELVAAGVADAAVVASRTQQHYEQALGLVEGGLRVLLEKPLTHSLDTARQFTAFLQGDPQRWQALMQAFQRRFDEPLCWAKQLLDQGLIGEPFKIVSVLEDPHPPPQGYQSPGLLADMSVHNIDEVCWLAGRRPERVASLGGRIYNHKVTTVEEDLDDAFLQMWFDGDLIGQVQVSRNHVAGYRNETWIYGDKGLIHVGAFGADPLNVEVEVIGRWGQIERRFFRMRAHSEEVPVFIARFGPAYKAQATHFVDQCLAGAPFAVGPGDGLSALEVVAAGEQAMRLEGDGQVVEYV
ncbi:MAG: hypothetical protein GKR89_04235 [Candidatus Latescibacteria bacterium]|nr:hypothetical protein [Candidatus Latescibacterota bacterium]